MKKIYSLIAASRANLNLEDKSYLELTVIASIQKLFGDIIGLCERLDEAKNFNSDYHEHRADIIYDADHDSDIEPTLKIHEDLKIRDEEAHSSFVSDCEYLVNEKFEKIGELLFHKFIYDRNESFIKIVFGSAGNYTKYHFVAACSGLTLDNFIAHDCEELCDDINNYGEELKCYAQIYRDNLEMIDTILIYSPNALETFKISGIHKDFFALFFEKTLIIEKILQPPIHEPERHKVTIQVNNNYTYLSDDDDIPF